MHTDPWGSKEPCAERCPFLIRETLDLIAAKWTVPILIALREAHTPLRYAELRRRVGAITPKELAKHLRQLEAAGLLHRRVHPTVPPSVEYSLTELGETLYPALESLADWALTFGRDVARNRVSRASHAGGAPG
ncbi:MAG TPA: helix-turn-helix domain-containing protein [Gemmatimonadaceae bacterium]